MKVMYPQYGGGLARQDDRYHTVPYRYGFLIGGVRARAAGCASITRPAR